MSDVVLRPVKPYVRIRRSVGKGGKARVVPLHWDAATLADLTLWNQEREANATEPFVCSRTGRPLDRKSVRRKYIQACKCLGRDEITTHDGRHTFVSLALAGGRSLAEVRDAAGHANVSTTSIYLHVVPDDGTVGDLFAA